MNAAVLRRRLLAAALLVSSVAGPAAAQAPLLFVMDPFPPFALVDNGMPGGPMAEMIQAACAVLKRDCTLKQFPWRRALEMVERGEADGIFPLANLPERAQQFQLMPPLIVSGYGIFVPEASPLQQYTKPADLDGYTVGAYGPSAATLVLDSLAASAPGIKTVVEIDNIRVLRMLSGLRYGPRSAALLNHDVGNHLLRSEGIAGVRLAGKVRRIEYCIGLSRSKFGSKEAADFAAVFQRLIEGGQIRAIATKYGVTAPER
ncbi:transporter substrate-binding domain-containing protein [Aquincola sp. S2]|uniref:Transporter substrate-binding domain-containing protein n=1 Tax=Pseudaquabacterium terrae TaxID=2732868 RepID=A0ABX2EGX5_9BURK|nr:transporter substrate-binding domain-containing protein [Aquabacterium terrae]NRF67872.1 transporter substrate-binding domain-containing protein [Aquabacterium terrae]